jgi:hypothetical protein
VNERDLQLNPVRASRRRGREAIAERCVERVLLASCGAFKRVCALNALIPLTICFVQTHKQRLSAVKCVVQGADDNDDDDACIGSIRFVDVVKNVPVIAVVEEFVARCAMTSRICA